MTTRVLLDSPCWIEYFLGTPPSEIYADHVKTSTVIVPSLCIFEVTRALLRQFEPEQVLKAISIMEQHDVIPLTDGVATNAAQLAVHLNLSSADAIVYATALQNNATLYTHDADLRDLDIVHYIER
jgi:toxin FitB